MLEAGIYTVGDMMRDRQYELTGNQRPMLQMDIGGMPLDKIARSIELLARYVRVRRKK